MRNNLFYRLLFVFIILITNHFGYSQKVDGVWIGNYQKAFLTPTPEKLIVEIFIHDDTLISGLSHLYYKHNKYEHYRISGKFNLRDSTVIFKEDSTLSVNMPFFASKCLGNYSMKLAVTDTALKLVGKWKDNNRSISRCPTSGVWLEKKLNNSATPPVTAIQASRKSDIQALIEVNKTEQDSIRVDVFDNGIIDNDSVSLYLNDSIIIKKQMITEKAISFFISLKDSKSKFSLLKLISESVGSIPPCTALMRVTTKSKRYEIRLSSSPDSNAAVEFFLKE